MPRSAADVLFVCTGNAGRSQMAETVFRQMAGDKANVRSAGVDPWPHLHPVAVKLMAERGADMAGQRPKHVQTMLERPFDFVITLGDNALADTPELPGNPRRMHWDIADPADADDTPEQEAVFRRTLESIEARLPGLLKLIEEAPRARELHMAPGISTCFSRPGLFKPAEHLPLAAAAGFRCIELNCFIGSADFEFFDEEKLRELEQAAEDTGLEIYSVHSSCGLTHPPGLEWWGDATIMDMFKYFADLTARLQAQVLVVHIGNDLVRASREATEDELRAALHELEAHMLPLPCACAWENEFHDHTPEQHQEWIRDLNASAFGFCLDTGHGNFEKTNDRHLAACRLRLCDLHLNDNAGEKDDHALLGNGTIDWDGFRVKLESTGYVGPLMLETTRADEEREKYGLADYLADAAASLKRLGCLS